MPGISPVTVGVVGCGFISRVYLATCAASPNLEVIACADLDRERAQAVAAEFGARRACTVEELLNYEEIEVVLNLTVPAAHAEVSLAALTHGKHVYSEKPLAIRREDGHEILATAASQGLIVGCAPDTFLGNAAQVCRRLIDEGAIGEPVAASAFMMIPGHESWHPNPDFYYQQGGGPMFDMGPYYLTALVNLIGPVRCVTSMTRITFAERTITSELRHGDTITVDVPTHVAGMLDFTNGAIGTVVTSFDVWSHSLPHIEIYGTEGTLLVPNPNHFDGTVRLRHRSVDEWRDVESTRSSTENARGLGLVDMAHAIRSGDSCRANGELAYHVLDIMCALHEASEQGMHVRLESTCERPAPI